MVKLPIYPTCGCHLPAGSLKQPFWRKELLSNPLEWQGICLLQGWSISLSFSPSKVPPMPANTSSQVQGCNENSGEVWYVSTISYVVIWGRSNMLLFFCESCFCIWDYLGFSQTMWKGREKTNKHDFENYLVFGKFVSICWGSQTFQTDVQTQFCCNACGEKHTRSVNHNYGLPSPPHFYLFFLEVSPKLLLFAHNRPMWFDVVIVALTLKRLQMQTRMLHQTSQHRHVPPPPPHNHHHHHHHHHHHNHHHRRYRHSSSFSSSSSAASSSSSHSKIEALKGNHVCSTWKFSIFFAACGKSLPQFTGQAPGNESRCKRQWINMVVHEINYCNPIINRTNQPMIFSLLLAHFQMGV